MSLSANSPSKEYIYAGGKVVATEESANPSTVILPRNLGVFFSGDTWRLDYDGDNEWSEAPPDKLYQPYGISGDIGVAGDWNGSGTSKIGVFRIEGGVGKWYLDINGNGIWNGDGVDKIVFAFGQPDDKPVVGDWNGSGSSKIGVFRITGGLGSWLVDYDGNALWEGTDHIYSFGQSGDQPVVGKW